MAAWCSSTKTAIGAPWVSGRVAMARTAGPVRSSLRFSWCRTFATHRCMVRRSASALGSASDSERIGRHGRQALVLSAAIWGISQADLFFGTEDSHMLDARYVADHFDEVRAQLARRGAEFAEAIDG